MNDEKIQIFMEMVAEAKWTIFGSTKISRANWAKKYPPKIEPKCQRGHFSRKKKLKEIGETHLKESFGLFGSPGLFQITLGQVGGGGGSDPPCSQLKPRHPHIEPWIKVQHIELKNGKAKRDSTSRSAALCNINPRSRNAKKMGRNQESFQHKYCSIHDPDQRE